jgi:hypothetical protein
MKYPKGLDFLQKISLTLMAILVLLTFLGTNMQAILWQSSKWLVGTVLPAVVIDLTNEERADNAAKPLHRNSTLDTAARMKAQHMANNEYFAHYAPDGTTPWHWFDEAGYVYAHAGENLAIHFTDSSEVVEAWMDSPTHRKNIVDAKFTEIGVGTAKGKYEGYETVYVVQLFGTPAVPPPAPVAQAQPATPVANQVALVEAEPTNVLASEDSVAEPVSPIDETAANVAQYSNEEKLPADAPLAEETTAIPVPTEDVVIVESLPIATSSGLAIANVVETNSEVDSSGIAGIATRPHLVLQIIYGVLASIVVLLLIASLFIEMRRVHPVQMAYSAGMLGTMALLLWVHTVLIHGAVIV